MGRDDIGQLAPGLRADIAIWDMSDVEASGSWDPAALLLAGPMVVKHLFVEGRHVVSDSWITTINMETTLASQARLLKGLMDG